MDIIDQVITDDYAIYNSDSIEIMKKMPDASCHFSVYSPPFAHNGGGLYRYSSSDRDLSNSKDYAEFMEHYEFFVMEMARVTMPGRISAVHCMDTPRNGANICGYMDFPGDIIRLHEKHGFEYTPRICIWKEPLEVRNRTMAKALYHIQIVEDSTQTNIAAADYLIPFRRKGENKIPVTHPQGLMHYAGSREVPSELLKYRGFKGNQIENRYSHWIWRQYASCFWDDVRLSHVVKFEATKAEEDDEKHVHPLQLDVIERAVVLWSNPGEICWTPFMGVGSEVCGAVMNGRKGMGCELKTSYFNQAKKNILACYEKKAEQLSLYDDI